MEISIFIVLITSLTAIMVAVITYFLNENAKRRTERYRKREEKYSNLIKTLEGFYINQKDYKLKNQFINEYRQCWLYCPDDIIKKITLFLNMLENNDVGREDAAADLILGLRKDLILNKPIRKTKLKSKDFKHVSATR